MMVAQETLWLKVSVPIASFAVPQAREFVESYPFPPPTTVYGMLLSYIGETDRRAYLGTELTILVESLPASNILIRKIRRFKKPDMSNPQNSKPDYQEILTGLIFYTGVRERNESGKSLITLLKRAMQNPEDIIRFGGLSCGESHNLIDQINIVENPLNEGKLRDDLWVLAPSSTGEWSVTVWADHVSLSKTNWIQASFTPVSEGIPDKLFFDITTLSSFNQA